MGTKKLTLLIAISLLLGLFMVSCNDKNNGPSESPNVYVNEWIYANMKYYYFWEDKIPQKSQTNLELEPDKYFESLLYAYDKNIRPDGDRFSWIQNNFEELLNSLSGVSTGEIGFEVKYYLISDASNDIVGEVSYVKPGTPAASVLKRGDLFNQVNGVSLTRSNYNKQFGTKPTNYTLTLVNPVWNPDNTLSGFTERGVKTINKIASYSENPVLLDTIYNLGTNKVGYLVYNFFSPDNGNGSANYDLLLNRIFGKFKNAPITDLVIDLRYNGGGSMSSAVNLASMIAPNSSNGKIATQMKFNRIYGSDVVMRYGTDALLYYFNNKVKTETINKVGNLLNNQRVYILTSSNTASASELIINSLKPFMDVYLVGEKTVGKNMGSYSIYKENDSKNKWGMQPIVLQYSNSLNESDFTDGFTPNIAKLDNSLTKKELGDINENLLNIALSQITGRVIGTQAKAMQVQEFTLHSSSIDKKPWNQQTFAGKIGSNIIPLNE